jgi:hypothetical protein
VRRSPGVVVAALAALGHVAVFGLVGFFAVRQRI